MKVPKYIQNIIDSGDVTVGVSDLDKEASFIGFPFKPERRGIAEGRLQAAAMGYNVYKDEKGNRFVLKSQPLTQQPDINVLLKGKGVDSWGKANLARNSGNALRKANARFVEPSNMDELENKAAQLYGRISQAQLRDAHHIIGINSSARWMGSLDPRRVESFRQMANSNGMYFGDTPRNLSAIPGERAINEPNLHQGVIHTATDPRSVTALLDYYNLPNATDPKRDFVAPFQDQFQYNSQKEAAALAGLAIERLGVQMTMLDNKQPGSAKTIKQSIDLIQNALRNTENMSEIGMRPNNTIPRELIQKLDAVKAVRRK